MTKYLKSLSVRNKQFPKKTMHKIFITLLIFISLSVYSKDDLGFKHNYSICDSLDIPQQFAFIPHIVKKNYSDDSRVGDWALSAPIAKLYGMKIDLYYDERYDSKMSAEVALKYISDLYKRYNDHWLTFLAFTHSAATVNKYLEINQGDSTCISSFYNSGLFDNEIIARYSLVSNLQTNVTPTSLVRQHALNEDNTIVNTQLFYTDILLEEAKITKDEFRTLNKCIRFESEFIDSGYPIKLPDYIASDTVTKIMNLVYEKSQHRNDSIDNARLLIAKKQEEARKRDMEAKRYKVKSGDTLGHIAQRYNVSVRALKQWNRLRSDMLQIGQIIKIYN